MPLNSLCPGIKVLILQNFDFELKAIPPSCLLRNK